MAMNISSGRSGGRGRRRGGRRAPMADINVTPFVDVVLVLLIIFMVTAPMLVTGVPVELPESRANALEQPEEPIEIVIDQSGTTYIDGTLVAPSELPARLEEIAGAQDAAKPRPIMLRGDTSISYGQMMRVMGELNRVGLNSVSLVTTGSSGEN